MRGQRSKAGILYGSRPKLTAKERPRIDGLDPRLRQIDGYAPQIVRDTIADLYKMLLASSHSVLFLEDKVLESAKIASPKLNNSAAEAYAVNFHKLVEQWVRHIHSPADQFHLLSLDEQRELIRKIGEVFAEQDV
jgi:hypothetical protein